MTRGNGKNVTVVFKKKYADWETARLERRLAAHIIKGKDMNEMFLNSVPVSSGPWKFSELAEGRPDHGRQEPGATRPARR